MTEYIAIHDPFAGTGNSPADAVNHLITNYEEYEGENLDIDDVIVFKVIRQGKATISVIWNEDEETALDR